MTDAEYRVEMKEIEERVERLIQHLQDLSKPFQHLSAHLQPDPQLSEERRRTVKKLENELDRLDRLIHEQHSA